MINDTAGATFAKLAGKGLTAPAVLSRAYVGTYDPATGTTSTGAASVCPCSAVRSAKAGRLGYLFGDGLVQGGDEVAMIAAKGLTLEPLPGDTLTMGGIQWAVIAVKPTYAGAVAVLFDLLVRK